MPTFRGLPYSLLRQFRGAGGAPAPAVSFTLSLSHSSGIVGVSETLTVTPNGSWTGGRSLAVTQSVSVFSVGSFSQPTAGTTTPVVVPLTVASAGGPSAINVTDSGASPLTSAGAQAYTATLGGGGTPTLLHSFDLVNWAGSSSAAFLRAGVPFARGAVPTGTAVQIKRGSTVIDAQFDERATWRDGSLKFAVMHLRDAAFTASESRTYDIWTVPSTAFSNSGTKALSDITGAHDFKVAFTSLTETDDTPTTTGVGSGAFTASFNTHSAVATRREKHHSGLVAEGWYLWGMATDNTGGAADAHLKTNWHVDIWKNSDNSIYAYEVGAVVTQDWWSVAGKKRRNYDAALKDGSTTIQSYAAVLHPYHQQWITCRNVSGDYNRGKRHWVGGAQPTLLYKPSKSYWVGSGVVPPLDTTFTPNAFAAPFGGTNDVYVPCGTQNHRGPINDVGAYIGRGVLSLPDSVAFMRQTAYDTAAARINGHCVLHYFCHFRSNRTRVRPGDSGVADTANTQISLIMQVQTDNAGTQLAVDNYNFTADGMPIPVHAYFDYRTDPAYQDGLTTGGGNGSAWSKSDSGSSHEPSLGYYIYALEGERYHLEANLDHAVYQVVNGIGSLFGNRPLNDVTLSNFSAYNNARPSGEQAQLLVGPFDAIASLTGEERNWGANVLGHGVGLVPDTHVAANFMKRLNRQQSYYIDAMLYACPPDVLAGGVFPRLDINTGAKHWMSAFNLLSAYHNYSITEEAGMKRWAAHFAMQTIGIAESGPRKAIEYVGMRKAKTDWWNPTTNPYLPRAEQLMINNDGGAISFQVTPTTVTTTTRRTSTTWPPLVGDKWYHKTRDEDTMDNNSPVAHTPPSGSTDGQPFYIISVSSVGGGVYDLQFSLTPGGSAYTWTELGIQVDFAMSGPSADAWTPGEGTGGDTYESIQRACMVEAYRQGHPNATSALVTKMQSFVSPTNDLGWATWRYA